MKTRFALEQRTLLDQLPAFVAVARADGIIAYWNRCWQAFTGHSDGGVDVYPRWNASVHPDDIERVEATWENAVAAGADFAELQYRVREAATGHYRWVRSLRTAVRSVDGTVDHYIGVAVCNDAYNEVVRLQARFQALVDANIIGIVTLDGEGNFTSCNDEFLRMTGYSREDVLSGRLNRWNLTPPELMERARRAEAELRSRGVFTPVEERYIRKDGTLVPVLTGGALQPGSDVDEISYVLDLTETKKAQYALEQSNAQLAKARDRERRIAEGLRALTEWGRALAASLDLNVVLETAASVVVPKFADWTLINVCDEAGDIVVAAARHADPQRDLRLHALVGHSCLLPSGRGGSLEVFRTGRLLYDRELTDEMLASNVKAEWLELFRSMAARSSVVVPLVAGGAVFGTFTFNFAESGRRYESEDLDLLADTGLRAAAAIENARRYQRERRVADRLQRAFLPTTLPRLPWAALDALYAAGHEEAPIGGDWYDAFSLPDGRLLVSVGDVVGRGLDAAATMGALRQAIRGAAQASPEPAAILDAVDRGIRSDELERLATAFVGIIDPFDATLNYASAGHPLPVVRTSSGPTELEGTGLPLGIRSRAKPRQCSRTVTLGEEAVLVLYTDGLTEARRDIAEAEKRLAQAVEHLPAGDHLAEYVYRTVLQGHECSAPDDIAIVTVRLHSGDDASWKVRGPSTSATPPTWPSLVAPSGMRCAAGVPPKTTFALPSSS